MKSWPGQLEQVLARRRTDQLLRQLIEVTSNGRFLKQQEGDQPDLINFAGNDYLALNQHPDLSRAAIDAIETHGVGAGASRLISGHHSIHQALEQRFARFKHAESALAFPTGYMANLAVLTTLAGPGDLICIDKLCHASLIDAARSSGATMRVFAHRVYNHKLPRLLADHHRAGQKSDNANSQQGDSTERAPRRLIVTDSVFSMDGDTADLVALCDLAERYDAMLVVDEAHATGILGETGAGLCELQGVSERVDVVVSTASKALGGLGGIVTARHVLIDTLINFARPFIYTTAMPAASAAVINAALDVVFDEPQRRRRVLKLATELRQRLESMGLQTPQTNVNTPIVPILVGSPTAALELSQALIEHGIYAPAIRPPTVASGASRVRLTLRADMLDEELDCLCRTLSQWHSRSQVHG